MVGKVLCDGAGAQAGHQRAPGQHDEQQADQRRRLAPGLRDRRAARACGPSSRISHTV